jgi:hypothetical protein
VLGLEARLAVLEARPVRDLVGRLGRLLRQEWYLPSILLLEYALTYPPSRYQWAILANAGVTW